MKKAVEIHISGKVRAIYKGEWWCCHVSSSNGKGFAIHQEYEDARGGLILPIKEKLVQAVADILFGFQDRNEMYDYPCPYVCELHINDDGTCRYRTTGADLSPWQDIHHKKDNSITAFLDYNAKGTIEWYQAESMLLHPYSIDSIVSLLKACGATDIDTEYITKSPSGHASINTQNAGNGMKIEIEWY